MRRVFGLGETVLDIVFKDGQPMAAKAGGSVLNALISLARMGHDCYFISEIGNDKVGDITINFLKQNNINTTYVQQYHQGQSAVAMAFLNDNNDAEYEFYKNYPSQRLSAPPPDFNKDDILLFGSSYAIAPAIRQQVSHIVQYARQQQCLIIYDPNFRQKHNENQAQYLSYLHENFTLADIVRGSNEDFDHMYQASSSEEAFLNIQNKCDTLIYTANARGVFMHSTKLQKHYPVPQINPVSTIGAGDNFNAGIIHGIINTRISRNALNTLSEEKWDFLMECGIKFSSEVCNSLDNYVPEGFGGLGIRG